MRIYAWGHYGPPPPPALRTPPTPPVGWGWGDQAPIPSCEWNVLPTPHWVVWVSGSNPWCVGGVGGLEYCVVHRGAMVMVGPVIQRLFHQRPVLGQVVLTLQRAPGGGGHATGDRTHIYKERPARPGLQF